MQAVQRMLIGISKTISELTVCEKYSQTKGTRNRLSVAIPKLATPNNKVFPLITDLIMFLAEAVTS